jgi:Tol biopolymer transport system component
MRTAGARNEVKKEFNMHSSNAGSRRLWTSVVVGALIVTACTSTPAPSSSPSLVAPSLLSVAVPTASPSASPIALQPTADTSNAPGTSTAAPQGQIVFDDSNDGTAHPQIYVEQADGSDVRRLVTSDFDDFNPALSPDGKQVVFSRTFAQDSAGIFIVNVDGTGLRQVDKTSCVKLCIADNVEGHAWSPDGTQVLITRVMTDGLGRIANVGVWVIKVDGSGARQVTGQNAPAGSQDGEGSWSPDGKHLVFQRNLNTSTNSTAIYSIALDGTHLQQVTPWTLSAGDPSWSPDGTLILFQSPAEPTPFVEQHIETIHPDGTGLTQLTTGMSALPDGRQGSFHPSWSPDGSQIVFTHFPASTVHGDLFVMNRDGSGLHSIGATALSESAAEWGPPPMK